MSLLIQLLLLLSITKLPEDPLALNRQNQVPVIMYHHLVPAAELAAENGNNMVISTEQFKEEMDWLHSEGYKTLSTTELHDFILSNKIIPQKSVVITFDDGYASVLTQAYPILEANNQKAIVFVITDNMNETSRKYDGRKLSWLDLKAMQTVFEVHSHTHYFHKTKDGLAYLLVYPYAPVYKDLEMAYHIIEKHLASNKRVLAYPYGDYNKDTLKAVSALETFMAFNTNVGYATFETPIYEIPRFTIEPTTTMEQFKDIITKKNFHNNK